MNKPSANREVYDPRLRPGFQPALFPKANGKEGPEPGAQERNQVAVLEFLAVYYWLNCEYARLLKVREPAASVAGEREVLEAIEKASIVRDELEDRYAPFGIIAEPVVKDGFTVDMKFTFGSVNAAGRLRGVPLTSSATIPIRLPPGVRLENLTLPGENPRSNS